MLKSLKYLLYRNKISLPDQLPPQLQFKIAQTKDEYIEASKILYDCYREKNYTATNANGLRLTPYHLLPTTTVILALWDQEIIGTVSLIRDNPLGLPLETIFDVTKLRSNHAVLCEGSSLAIKKEFRGKSGQIFHPLLRYMWNYAYHYFGVDYMVIAVNPSMYELYESVYLFEPLKRCARAESYDFANNNPAVGEFLNMRTFFNLYQKKYGKTHFSKNLYSFMIQDQKHHALFPKRKYYSHLDSPVKSDWVTELAIYIPEIQDKPILKDRIAQAFGYLNYQELNCATSKARVRIPVSFTLINYPNCKIVDISESGLKLVNHGSAEIGCRSILNCKISNEQSARILVEPAWENTSDRARGYRILDSSEDWVKMVQNTVPSGAHLQITEGA